MVYCLSKTVQIQITYIIKSKNIMTTNLKQNIFANIPHSHQPWKNLIYKQITFNEGGTENKYDPVQLAQSLYIAN